MSHSRTSSCSSSRKGPISHGLEIVSDFFHGRKHQHHHNHNHNHAAQADAVHYNEKVAPALGEYAVRKPVEEPASAEPAAKPPVQAEEPKVETVTPPTMDTEPAAADAAPSAVAAPEPVVVKSGPVLTAPYHLFCWGTPDSVTKSTSYTSTPLPASLLSRSCTFAVCARTMQDGPRCILSLESPSAYDSLLWLGTVRTNLVHCSWADGPDTHAQASSEERRVGYSEPWTRLVVVWDVERREVGVWVDGVEMARRGLSEAGLEVVRGAEYVSLVLGRGKENKRRAYGWDGEICDARVWDRALDAEEIASLEAPAAIHPQYITAWNDAYA